jgi:hypothetical protein
VPAVVDVGSPAVRQRRLPRGRVEASTGAIEVEIDGVTIRVGRRRGRKDFDDRACPKVFRGVGNQSRIYKEIAAFTMMPNTMPVRLETLR